MKSKEKTFIIITLFFIAYMMFPPITTLFPVAYVSLGFVMALLLLFPNSFRNNYFKWFIIYFAVLFAYSLFNHNYHINGIGYNYNLFNKLTIEAAWILPGLMICSIITRIGNTNVFRQLAIGTIAILVLSMIIMLPSVLADSNAIRDNIRMAEGTNDGNILLPSYTVISCYAFILPVVCYGFKCSKRFVKLLFGGFILLTFFIIIKTEVTTSFITAAFVLLFTLVYRNNGVQNLSVIFSFIAFIIFLLYESGILLSIIELLINVYDGTVAQGKFIEFQNMLLGNGEGDNLEVRKICREMSMNCFLSNPIIGSPDVGGHSSLLDRLGSMGLLGFIPFVMMLITNVQMWIRFMPNRGPKFFYIIGIIIIAIFLYAKGLFSGQGMLFLFVILPATIIGIFHQFNQATLSKNRKT